MLFYMFIYVLAAVLIFQGVNLLGQRAGSSPVPPEVKPAAGAATRWGTYLVGFGVVLALLAILSHAWPGLVRALALLRNLGFASVAVYGLWLVFGRKIDYSPAPPTRDAHSH